MTTIARPTSRLDSHWYTKDAQACYELPKKDGSGMKVPTLADARKLNLLPSVTTILKIMAKPELQKWIVEQAVLSVLTTPRNEGEQLDAFIQRVLHDEKIQDQEAQAARDKGVAIHDAMERYFTGQDVPEELRPWIMPAAEAVGKYGEVVAAEKILVGKGFAGKTDLIQKAPLFWWVWDFKTSKKLPDPKKGAWKEHRLQLAAYANAFLRTIDTGLIPEGTPIRTANCYISTTEQGQFVICENGPWSFDWEAFEHLLRVWQWDNQYTP